MVDLTDRFITDRIGTDEMSMSIDGEDMKRITIAHITQCFVSGNTIESNRFQIHIKRLAD